ncbi:hypothetical protein FVE85_2036 [Porphyridium purpureum]|uniref:Uncharacterized protein n=1 Tax=Porphyridium purpureum TaxID=35688 RepID=A0A5J4YWG3_PORPP|nr:hypothetical protein FVE85_2036 [Porphyridium purpureum]|eukprot:POR6796..scf209_3
MWRWRGSDMAAASASSKQAQTRMRGVSPQDALGLEALSFAGVAGVSSTNSQASGACAWSSMSSSPSQSSPSAGVPATLNAESAPSDGLELLPVAGDFSPYLSSQATGALKQNRLAKIRPRMVAGVDDSAATGLVNGSASASGSGSSLRAPALDRLNFSDRLAASPRHRLSPGTSSMSPGSDTTSESGRSPGLRKQTHSKEPLSARIRQLSHAKQSQSREKKFLEMIETCFVTQQDHEVVSVAEVFASLQRSTHQIRRFRIVVVNNFIRSAAIQQYRDSIERAKQEIETVTRQSDEDDKSVHTIVIGSGPQLLIGQFCETLGLNNVSGVIHDTDTYDPEKDVTVLADPVKNIYGAFTAWRVCVNQSESPRSMASADVTQRFRSFLELTEPSTSNAKHQFMCFAVLDCIKIGNGGYVTTEAGSGDIRDSPAYADLVTRESLVSKAFSSDSGARFRILALTIDPKRSY